MPANKGQKVQIKEGEKKDSMSKKTFGFVIMLIGVALGVLFVATVLTFKTEEFNKAVFGLKKIQTQNERITLVKKLALWLSLLVFGLSVSVMTLRILTVRPNPAKGNDGQLINTLNRIISNTIQQAVIFAGVYGTLLFDGVDHVQIIGGAETLAFAGLFFFGRLAFTVGFIVGVPLKLPTLRASGFAINLTIIVLMVSRLVQYNLIPTFKQTFVPIVDMIL